MCIKGRATPWERVNVKSAPCKGKSIDSQTLLPFQGENCLCSYFQGVALGYMLIGLSGRQIRTSLNYV